MRLRLRHGMKMNGLVKREGIVQEKVVDLKNNASEQVVKLDAVKFETSRLNAQDPRRIYLILL